VLSKGRIRPPDFAETEFDSFVYRNARAFGMGRSLAIGTVLSERGDELRREKINFDFEPFCSPAIIELLGLVQLTSQIFKVLTVFGFCSWIQRHACIAEIVLYIEIPAIV
jgi:hypothetical protein